MFSVPSPGFSRLPGPVPLRSSGPFLLRPGGVAKLTQLLLVLLVFIVLATVWYLNDPKSPTPSRLTTSQQQRTGSSYSTSGGWKPAAPAPIPIPPPLTKQLGKETESEASFSSQGNGTEEGSAPTGPLSEGNFPRISPFLSYGRGNVDHERREHVKKMIQFAWTSYESHASGYDELKPITKKGENWYHHYSLLSTPVDSLDTLFLAGLHDEYERCKEIVLKRLNLSVPIRANVFETTIRVLGGLESAYELEGDWRFIEKAVELADRLLPAFDTPTGIPVNYVNLKSGDITAGFVANLAEAGTLALEFQYLSDVTGDPKYAEAALFAMDQLWSQERHIKGLLSIDVNVQGLKSSSESYGIAAGADSYYEYLLKLWLSTHEPRYRDMYIETARAMTTYLLQTSKNGAYVYIPDTRRSDYNNNNNWYRGDTFHHLSCFAGGMFGLGALSLRYREWTHHLDVARRITETCYLTYHNNKKTGLGMESAVGETLESKGWQNGYLLRPETVESIFYMWRFTHDPMYREWGWEIVQ
ncbi:Mannosyl-oligosaccharide 1,2-alpha-mannosidase IB, partial [Quaeritorhiza haematococci]